MVVEEVGVQAAKTAEKKEFFAQWVFVGKIFRPLDLLVSCDLGGFQR